MIHLLSAEVSATQWVLLGLILVLIILYPVFMVFKNKKEREKFDELSEGLNVGDKVLTSSGVYGEIIDIKPQQSGKLVVLKTGDEDHVGYVGVDVLAIYTVFKEEEETIAVEEPQEDTEQTEEVKEEPKEEKKAKKTSKKSEK